MIRCGAPGQGQDPRACTAGPGGTAPPALVPLDMDTRAFQHVRLPRGCRRPPSCPMISLLPARPRRVLEIAALPHHRPSAPSTRGRGLCTIALELSAAAQLPSSFPATMRTDAWSTHRPCQGRLPDPHSTRDHAGPDDRSQATRPRRTHQLLGQHVKGARGRQAGRQGPQLGIQHLARIPLLCQPYPQQQLTADCDTVTTSSGREALHLIPVRYCSRRSWRLTAGLASGRASSMLITEARTNDAARVDAAQGWLPA